MTSAMTSATSSALCAPGRARESTPPCRALSRSPSPRRPDARSTRGSRANRAPRAPRFLASAAPMPALAPVMTTTRPCMRREYFFEWSRLQARSVPLLRRPAVGLARRRVRLPVHRRDELLKQVARLGLRLQMVEQERRDFAEGLLVGQPVARAGRDLLAPRRQVFLERLCVARELRAKLLDLPPQIPRLRLLLGRLLLVLLELLSSRVDESRRGARPLEQGAGLGCPGVGAVCRLPGLRGAALGLLEHLAQPRDLALLGRQIAQRT